MAYFGNRTLLQQKTTETAVRNLFSDDSFMSMLLREAFEVASYDKIIPQFGADDRYYSVLQYLFSGRNLNSNSPGVGLQSSGSSSSDGRANQ